MEMLRCERRLSAMAALHPLQRQLSTTLFLWPCWGLRIQKKLEHISTFLWWHFLLRFLDVTSKAWTFLGTLLRLKVRDPAMGNGLSLVTDYRWCVSTTKTLAVLSSGLRGDPCTWGRHLPHKLFPFQYTTEGIFRGEKKNYLFHIKTWSV